MSLWLTETEDAERKKMSFVSLDTYKNFGSENKSDRERERGEEVGIIWTLQKV